MQQSFHKNTRSVASITNFWDSHQTKVVALLILSRILTFILPLFIWQVTQRLTPTVQMPQLNWNRWDAPHFLYIAQYGYTPFGDEANFIVFPPLYPLAIKLFALVVGHYDIAAILSANLFFILGGLTFYNFVKLLYSKEVAQKAVFLLIIFPTAYFFSAPYTESLFLFLAALTLLAAYKKYWLLAGALGGLAFLTRHPGIFLLPALLIEAWIYSKDKLKATIEISVPFLLFVGAYLYLNYIVFGDMFAFRTILENHWYKHLASPWQGIWSSWQASKAGLTNEYSRMLGLAEAIPATLSVLAIPLAWRLVKRPSLVFLYTSTVLFICSTSFLMSTSRYLVTIPPLFIAFGIFFQKHEKLYYIWIFISAALLTYFSHIFVGGQWAF